MNAGADEEETRFAEARAALVRQVDAEVAETAGMLGVSRLSDGVRAALGRVPRHRFVPEHARAFAYDNRPLPIGQGQTISQPYIVAVTTELARPGPDDRVLEIGTGCGYQAAMLAELAGQVFTVEARKELADTAKTRLGELGYANVTVRHGDGARGWPEEAPFDAIVVTAAAPESAEHRLAEQLAPGGRMVIPLEHGGLGARFGLGASQELTLVEADADGRLHRRGVLPVAFVPLVGGAEEDK